MAVQLFLDGGGVAYVDEEDEEECVLFRWRLWAMKPSGVECAHVRVFGNYRAFDLYLHRFVAIRMNPTLERKAWLVSPRDGDYLNCRRENLAIRLSSNRRQVAKPVGSWNNAERPASRAHESSKCEGLHPDVAKLWNPGKQFKVSAACGPLRGYGRDRSRLDANPAKQRQG